MKGTIVTAVIPAFLLVACVAAGTPAGETTAPPASVAAPAAAVAVGCGDGDVTLPPPRDAAVPLTGVPQIPILKGTEANTTLPQEVGEGIPVAHVPTTYVGVPILQVNRISATGDPEAIDLTVYYGSGPITEKTTLGDIYRSDGAVFSQNPTRGATGQHVIV